jgi:hypothetical protein
VGGARLTTGGRPGRTTKTDVLGMDYPPVPSKDMEKAVGKAILIDERTVVRGRGAYS